MPEIFNRCRCERYSASEPQDVKLNKFPSFNSKWRSIPGFFFQRIKIGIYSINVIECCYKWKSNFLFSPGEIVSQLPYSFMSLFTAFKGRRCFGKIGVDDIEIGIHFIMDTSKLLALANCSTVALFTSTLFFIFKYSFPRY